MKSVEIRDREMSLKLKLDAIDRGTDENADLAIKAFELSQRLSEKWVTAGGAEKRTLIEMVCLNLTLENVNLVATWRKPFDQLAEGAFLKNNRGDKTPVELFALAAAELRTLFDPATDKDVR
jgi:hypothetical protein